MVKSEEEAVFLGILRVNNYMIEGGDIGRRGDIGLNSIVIPDFYLLRDPAVMEGVDGALRDELVSQFQLPLPV